MCKHKLLYKIQMSSTTSWGGSRGVMVKAVDCGIVVSEFDF